jgi:hypothetical protein
MTEQQLGDLLQRVGAAVRPDVAGLVAAGVERGRRRQRRRRAATALVAVAATAAVLVPVAVVVGRDDAAPSVVQPTDRQPRVAVPAGEMTEVLLRLLPGSTPAEDDEPYVLGVQRAVVRWRGVQVSVAVDARFLDGGVAPAERCATFRDGPCTRAGDAGWLTAYALTAGRTPDGVEPYQDVVRRYDPAGWVVEATGERGDAREVDAGRGSDADRALLRRLVLDHAWFR